MLIIEDAADIREVFAVLLRAEGADVVAVPDGRAALAAATRQHFDVILSDLGLPDLPGDVVIRQLLASTRNRARVIVITGYGEPYLTRARQAGADAVFTKPVDWARILDYLQHSGLAASA